MALSSAEELSIDELREGLRSEGGRLEREALQIDLHLRAEVLIGAISSRLLNVPLAELERGLDTSLEELGRASEVQRAYVFLLSEDGARLAHAYEWVEEGIEAHDLESFRGVSVDAFPWSMAQFARGETVLVGDPDALPEEAAAERGTCEALSIDTYVNLPLYADRRVLGWLGFDSVGEARVWSASALKLMAIASDVITAAIQRKRREELAFRERELRHRVASANILAAGLAHEINNPLAFTIGNLAYLDELLEPSVVTDSAKLSIIQQALADASEGAERVRRIVGDLRLLANGTGSEVVPVDIIEVIDASLRVADNQLKHRAQVERRCESELRVLGTSSKLGQLLLNLVINAAKAVPEGEVEAHRVSVRAFAQGEAACIEVLDTGCGIAPEDLPHIFDPFYTTREVGDGMGVGLAICHQIVTSLGGEIEVESELGVGTRVRVTLSRPPEDCEPAVADLRARVLVIDDEPRIVDMVCRFLEGFEPVVAANGREALERLAEFSDFDIVICDVMMPEIGGLDVYRAVAERYPGLEQRFVFMSGGSLSAAIDAELGALPNTLVRKPFLPRDLRAAVAEITTAA